MARFDTALKFLLSPDIEGGLSNDPADRGGLTNFGITQKTFDAWNTKREAPKTSVSNIQAWQVRAIYEAEYWLKAACDRLPEPVDILHFDSAVNHGVLNAGRMLQEAVAMPKDEIDGIVGPKTLATCAAIDPNVTFARYVKQRLSLYVVLTLTKPGQKRFIRGWLHRLGHALVELV